MSINRKMVVILGCIIFIVFLIIGYLVVNDVVQAHIFKKEISRIENLDIRKDQFDNKLITVGKHRVIEKKIKNYLSDYSSSLTQVSKIMNNKKLSNLLSIENCKNDGKEFSDSINYINSTKENFNKKIDELISMSSKEKILDNISDVSLDSYYISLYNNAMLNGKINSQLVTSSYELKKSKEDFNNLLDNTLEVLIFLKKNKADWEIENNKIMFQNSNLMEEYNNLILKVKK